MSSEQVLVCYRETCKRAAHPCGYNRVTHGLYCTTCAIDGHLHSRDEPGGSFYPLITYKGKVRHAPGGQYVAGVIMFREHTQPEPEPQPEPIVEVKPIGILGDLVPVEKPGGFLAGIIEDLERKREERETETVSLTGVPRFVIDHQSGRLD